MAQGEAFSAALVAPAVTYICKWLARHSKLPVRHGSALDSQVEVHIAGSARRRVKEIHDVDLVVALPEECPRPCREWGNEHMRFERGGAYVQRWRYAAALPVELYLTDHVAKGATLLHCTGAVEFNVWMRLRAIQSGMRLSQWGLFKGDELVAARTEADVFHALDVPFVPPWRRQGPPT